MIKTSLPPFPIWGKQDIIQRYGLRKDKVKIVPWAPVLTAYTATQEPPRVVGSACSAAGAAWAHRATGVNRASGRLLLQDRKAGTGVGSERAGWILRVR